ncbi:MAG: TonB-dependent siderophore receptor [Rheinheimera sp.]|uniref:TonB-dependent receptor n=1 Tax=Arsukibacterium sp. UBA3155 TaxID=1946058 RepID=UPI000C979CA2|nr:TonB-dependent receptor [Arsukibacterium sp. UBA3155]MAD74704.1 TonB-dependent siderophore receptor [Rheinheimera sp.]|tara:strand:- start:144281 stop:146584 length:2304 start_codon:yes stop_codon:yes gene_type:complete
MTERKHPLSTFGSQALFTALALNAVHSSATEMVDTCVATDTQCTQEAIELIKVHGVRSSVYSVKQSGDLRRLAELTDTPHTITVLTKDQIEESGKTDLKEILAAQAGVTLGTGENGNAFGDRYIIRGHEARSDVFVDGLRDPGMTTRESFATEQIEITKGPSSTFAGRGSSGGAVNSITKKASTSYSFGRVDASVGSDEHHRLVLDYNTPITTDTAFRLNLLSTAEDAPNRDGISRNRDGALLSGVYDNAANLRVYADGYYLNAADKPDLGSYFNLESRKPVSDIPVYAQEEDFLDSDVSAFTLRTEYNISDNVRFYNATRYGQTSNGYLATGARGTVRSEDDPQAPGASTIGLSTHQGWQDVEYFATQFNLFWDLKTARVEHKLLFGLEFTDESVDNGVYDISYNNSPNCTTTGRSGSQPGYCLLDADGQVYQNSSRIIGRSYSKDASDALFSANTIAFYAMDTAKINEYWQVFAGLRLDQIDYSNDVVSRGDAIDYAYKDNFYNGHVGIVYSITDEGNLYLSYSTATNINGGESDLGANCGYGGLCGDPEQAAMADPETVQNIEFGTKWAVLNEKLFIAAAVFQMTKTDVMESVGDAYSTLGTLNTGKNRIQGVEIALNGAVTDKLSLQASAAIMDSEVMASIDPANLGLELSNFANNSFYLQMRYQLTEAFAFGGDYSYQSEMFGGQPDTAAGYDTENGYYSIRVPGYAVVNVFANYNVNDSTTVRVNIGNVSDKEYWTAAYRSGSFMYLGDARSIKATLTYEF